jgi:hypothetical protein
MDLRDGVAVPPEMLHDGRLPVGRRTAAIAPQDPTAADVVDVRRSALPDEGTGIVPGRRRAFRGHAWNSTLRAPDRDWLMLGEFEKTFTSGLWAPKESR